MKLLNNLPDWMNPVFVKDLRQTFSGKYLLIVSIIAVVLELLFFLSVCNNPSPNQNQAMGILVFYLEFGILFCAVLMISHLSHWVNERASDAIAPERMTPLPSGTIIRGKVWAIIALQCWGMLLWMPFAAYLGSFIHDPIRTKSFLISIGLWFLNQIVLCIWAALISLISKPQRTPSWLSKFGGCGFLIIASFILHVLLSTFTGLLIFSMQNESELSKDILLLFAIPVILGAYGILLIHSTAASKHANKMFPARFGGLILLGIAAAILHYCDMGFGSIIFLLLTYLTFQFIVVCNDSCIQPERMKLDAPENPVLKFFWYFCGTGMKWGWLYNAVLFVAVLLLLQFTDGGEGALGRILIVDSCFAAIYAAITCWICLGFYGRKVLNGPGLFLVIWIGSLITTFFFALADISLKITSVPYLIDMLSSNKSIENMELPLPMDLLIVTAVFAICTVVICFTQEAKYSAEKNS